MSNELIYLLLIFGLLVIPRALQRFKLPAPITCLLLGVGAMLLWGERTHDPVVVLLSTLGISSLFLFAGLEVDPAQLRRGLRPLLAHLAVRSVSLVGVAWLGWEVLELGWQPAALVALALLTPSTGFILDTLERLGLDEEERFWVTSNTTNSTAGRSNRTYRMLASTSVNTSVGDSASATFRLLRRCSPNISRRCSQTTPMRSGTSTSVSTTPRPSASQVSASREISVPAWKK